MKYNIYKPTFFLLMVDSRGSVVDLINSSAADQFLIFLAVTVPLPKMKIYEQPLIEMASFQELKLWFTINDLVQCSYFSNKIYTFYYLL